MRKAKLVLFFFSLLMLSACSLAGRNSQLTAVTPPAPPQEGMATVVGRCLSEKTGEPLPNTLVRLAEVVRSGDEGAYVLDQAFSPGAVTDEKGYFIFENIKAMEYVVVVGDINFDYKIIENEEKKPRVWNALAGQILDIGVLKVDLEPQ